MKVAVICALLIAGALHSDATQCYECDGPPDGDCAKAVVESMKVVTCEGISLCHYTDTRSGSERGVSRGCTKDGPTDLCTLLYQLAASNPMGLRVFECKTCRQDKCNIQITN
uniref:Uncharacterized protein n=1 Tax=Lygus hesperus TaxID=30085 RepID=A0A146MAR0_LYGHE